MTQDNLQIVVLLKMEDAGPDAANDPDRLLTVGGYPNTSFIINDKYPGESDKK